MEGIYWQISSIFVNTNVAISSDIWCNAAECLLNQTRQPKQGKFIANPQSNRVSLKSYKAFLYRLRTVTLRFI
jgi:hypothetical protein